MVKLLSYQLRYVGWELFDWERYCPETIPRNGRSKFIFLPKELACLLFKSVKFVPFFVRGYLLTLGFIVEIFICVRLHITAFSLDMGHLCWSAVWHSMVYADEEEIPAELTLFSVFHLESIGYFSLYNIQKI